MIIKQIGMKKQLRYLAGLLLLLTSSISFAQNADAQVKKIVQSLRDPQNVAIRFNYQYLLNNDEKPEAKQGQAFLQGECYKIIMEEQQTISDGKTIWTYLVEEGECMVSNASEGTDNTTLKLLTTLDKDYTATAKDATTIELSNPKGEFKKVLLTLDKKKNEIKALEIVADDGSKLVITFLETKTDQELGKDFFTFDEKKHPDVEIIDMR